MCGIVGYVGKNKAIPIIMNGLKTLEYRGYDSAGIAYVKDKKIKIIKKEGMIKNLDSCLNYDDKVNMGIAHTRWATHGEANEVNAHPHNKGKITLVHNGIIENYEEIKTKLTDYDFVSDTDTEVATALIDSLYAKEKNMISVLIKITKILKGSYAFAIINEEEDAIYAIRKDSPLIIGKGNDESMLASDIPAILEVTNEYVVLDNYEIAKLTKDDIKYYDLSGGCISKDIRKYLEGATSISKNGYEHYMLKEINEEADVVNKILSKYISGSNIINIFDIERYKKIDIVACGSACYAGYVGKYYIEKYANIETNVYLASEYRYQKNFFSKDKLVIFVSQSGETADTLASLKLANESGVDTLAIVNVRESSIARISKYVIYTESGLEIAVATTKAYLSQVIIMILLALNTLKDVEEYIISLKEFPKKITEYINKYDYESLASSFINDEHIFYLGRSIDYYLAMEGSLKLKEISYIHSEAFPAGELKHGSISLINKGTSVICIATNKDILDKTVSNLKEVIARGAKVLIISNYHTSFENTLKLDDLNEFINPLLSIVPMQLLAYNIAKLRGCNIDKPKNLAKSVTVE